MNKTKSCAFALSAFFLFALCGCSGSKSKDKVFLDEVNKILTKSKKDLATCHDAVTVINDAGIDLENHEFTHKDYCFAFDIKAQRFVIMNDKNKIVCAPNNYHKSKNSYDYFKFTNAYDENSIYSQYLTSDFAGADLLPITTGLDMGVNRNVKTIMYNNTTGIAKDVTIRTFCDYLTIEGVTDTVRLYYCATNVYVSHVKELHECATASSAYLQVSSGTVYFEKNPVGNVGIDLFEIPEGCNVTTYCDEGAVVYGAINAPKVQTMQDVILREVDDSSDFNFKGGFNFFRLTKDVTFDDDDIKTDVGYSGSEYFLRIDSTCCIDLNGKRLSFLGSANLSTYRGTGFKAAIVLDALAAGKEVDCYILDSKSTVYQRSGIYEFDSCIISRGSNVNATNLTINAGKISAERQNVGDPAVVSVGQNAENNWIKKEDRTSENISHSVINMYGGYVDIRNPSGTTNACKALQPKGYGATVNIYYGNLSSDGYCISGMGNQDDIYGGTTINITSGVFNGAPKDYEPTDSDRGYSNLFFPQGGTVNIKGGKFTGTTCLNAKSGQINIANAQFEAFGSYYGEKGGCNNGVYSDGSVFTVESNESVYETKEDSESCLHITVQNSLLTSKQGYVTRFVGLLGTETGHTQYPHVYLDIKNSDGYYKLGQMEIHDDNIIGEFVHYTESDNVWSELA